MDSLFDTLLDAVPGKLGSAAAALVPDDWKRRARARLRDENPLARIALNHDLLRAVRLAWVEAALAIVTEASRLAHLPHFADQRADIRAFANLATTTLRRVRDEALQTERVPGACPIDDQARAVIEGVAEAVAPGAPGPHSTQITYSFGDYTVDTYGLTV